jgi:hypothetical protein
VAFQTAARASQNVAEISGDEYAVPHPPVQRMV